MVGVLDIQIKSRKKQFGDNNFGVKMNEISNFLIDLVD